MLDLLGSTDGPIDLAPMQTRTINANTISNSTSNNQDLLDLLGGIDLTSPVLSPGDGGGNNIDIGTNGNNIFSALPPAMNAIGSPTSILTTTISSTGIFDDLSALQNNGDSFGGSMVSSSATTGFKLTALDKNGINVILVPQKSSGCLQVMMTATNSSLSTVEQFLFQAAVPKSFTLQMLSPSGSLLPPGGTITQEMRLTNSAKVSIFNHYYLMTNLKCPGNKFLSTNIRLC